MMKYNTTMMTIVFIEQDPERPVQDKRAYIFVKGNNIYSYLQAIENWNKEVKDRHVQFGNLTNLGKTLLQSKNLLCLIFSSQDNP